MNVYTVEVTCGKEKRSIKNIQRESDIEAIKYVRKNQKALLNWPTRKARQATYKAIVTKTLKKVKDFPLLMSVFKTIDVDSGHGRFGPALNPDSVLTERFEEMCFQVVERILGVLDKKYPTLGELHRKHSTQVEACSWWAHHKDTATVSTILECIATPEDDMGIEIPLIAGISAPEICTMSYLLEDYFEGQLGQRLRT